MCAERRSAEIGKTLKKRQFNPENRSREVLSRRLNWGRYAGKTELGARQVSMQCRDHLGAFTDRRGDPLDRCCAYVADRKHAAACCLQCMASTARLGSGQNEAFCINGDPGTFHPIGIWIGADK